MAQNRMMPPALLEQLQGADTDVLQRVLEHAMQRLIEAEAATAIRRLSRGEIPPSEMGPAVAGAVIGALLRYSPLICLADVVAILMFGSPIPAT